MVPAVITGGVLSITVVTVVVAIFPHASIAEMIIVAGQLPVVLAECVIRAAGVQLSVDVVTARAAASAAPTVGKHDAIVPVETVGGVLSILVV